MKFHRLILSLGLGMLIIGATNVSAASHCKGLAENACAADSSCRWVGGYVRKDGRQVAAHCRLGKAGAKTLGKNAAATKLSASK